MPRDADLRDAEVAAQPGELGLLPAAERRAVRGRLHLLPERHQVPEQGQRLAGCQHVRPLRPRRQRGAPGLPLATPRFLP